MSEAARYPRKRVLESTSSEDAPQKAPPSDTSRPAPTDSYMTNRRKGELTDLASQPATHKKKKTKPESIIDMDKYAYDLIKDMKDIHSRDTAHTVAGEPAVERLKNVESISGRILRRDVQDVCIRLGALNEIRRWLEPLTDRSLPNQRVKKVLLDLLHSLKLTKDDLYSSEIGKIVNFYSKNSREARDVRRMASALIKKWKDMVIREETQDE